MARQLDDEDGMAPLERGRLHYKQKDYDRAVKAFSEVCMHIVWESIWMDYHKYPVFVANGYV